MRFKKMDTFTEDLYPELRQFFGDTKNRTSNASGAKYITDETVKELKMKIPGAQECYVLHHINGDHSDTTLGNEILILSSEHNKLHSLIHKTVSSNPKYTDTEVRYKLGLYAKVRKISILVDALKRYVDKHDVGITSDKIQFSIPVLETDETEFDKDRADLFTRVFNSLFFSRKRVCVKFPNKTRPIYTFEDYFTDESVLSKIIVK